ncbi:MAG: adenylyltransferase/cytidyltransferase family protein [Candidatus Omnitrophica bacterium]|nr:adenylyltransferase/cytidyltransferase family protein [Candidatus Omnitrophota bacterium]
MREIARKIKTLGELAKISRDLKARGKKIVHCHGVYDLVHPGHIRHLAAAKKHGDVLIVTLTKDRHVKRGPGRPIFNEHLRAETLASLAAVEYVAAVDYPTAVEAIRAIRPDFYVKGQDYSDRKKDVTGKIYDEEKAVKASGGRVVFTDDITFSSSALINRHMEVYPPETVSYLKRLVKRYSVEDALGRMADLKKLKVLVIGDAIIDQYHYCRPMAKSSKEPIVVNKYLSEESFAGGAIATANHAAQVCGRVDLVTVLGKKEPFERFIRTHLGPNVAPRFFYRGDGRTTVKRRFVHSESPQKFFEVCYMDDAPLASAEEQRLAVYLNANLKRYDLVIVNDFGHGMLTPRLIEILCRKSRFLALNVQTNSANLGFNLVTKYGRADFVCIDEFEMRLATRERSANLKDLVRRIQKKLRARVVAVTRGKDGALCYSAASAFTEAPAFSYHIVDKVGAGDAFFAYTAPCFAAGVPQDLTAFIGNAVGSLAVQIMGNREPVKVVDLVKFMTRLLKF